MIEGFFFRILCRGTALAIAALFIFSGSAPLSQTQLTRPEIRVFSIDDDLASKQILAALRSKYAEVFVTSDLAALAQRKSPGLCVTLGANALSTFLSRPSTCPLVSLFATKQDYERIASSYPERTVTAIFAETSIETQLRLIASLYGRRVAVVALVPEQPRVPSQSMRALTRELDIELQFERPNPQENLARALARIGSFDVLLHAAGNASIDSSNLRTILEATYRRSQGLIGFSPAVVQAGMLGATYASTDDILAHFGEIVDRYTTTQRLPEPQYPKYWRVAINESVARSFSLRIGAQTYTLGRQQEATAR
jgi:putative tryptophan/tyrosine transport system substrate-binding protein